MSSKEFYSAEEMIEDIEAALEDPEFSITIDHICSWGASLANQVLECDNCNMFSDFVSYCELHEKAEGRIKSVPLPLHITTGEKNGR